jgi:hypothetical protein
MIPSGTMNLGGTSTSMYRDSSLDSLFPNTALIYSAKNPVEQRGIGGLLSNSPNLDLFGGRSKPLDLGAVTDAASEPYLQTPGYSVNLTDSSDLAFPGMVVQAKKNGSSVISDKDIQNQLKNAGYSDEVNRMYKATMESEFGRQVRSTATDMGYDGERTPDFFTWLKMDSNVYAVTITLTDDFGREHIVLGLNEAHKDVYRNLQAVKEEHGSSAQLDMLDYVMAHEQIHVSREANEALTDRVATEGIRNHVNDLDGRIAVLTRQRQIAEGWMQYGQRRVESQRDLLPV